MADKHDIQNRDDIVLLMEKFYKKLLADESISYLFTDVAKIDLEHHLPILADFWESILFHKSTYGKNAMQPHIALHHQSPLNKEHFETWLSHFNTTVDELFEGDVAFIAKQKALSIATTMQLKLGQFT